VTGEKDADRPRRRVIAITGTPGTGKTTVASLIRTSSPILHLNDALKEWGCLSILEEERQTRSVDLDCMFKNIQDSLDGLHEGEHLIVEGHLSHMLPTGMVDSIIVLRLDPRELDGRLRARGYGEDKVMENLEAEMVAVSTQEAVCTHGSSMVHEVDTTGKEPDEIASILSSIVSDAKGAKRSGHPVGGVEFLSEEIMRFVQGEGDT